MAARRPAAAFPVDAAGSAESRAVFWQLQVVKFIRNVLKTRVGGCVRDAVRSAASEEPQDPVQVVASAKAHVEKSSELEGALRQLRSDVEQEVARLTRLLSAEKENKRGLKVQTSTSWINSGTNCRSWRTRERCNRSRTRNEKLKGLRSRRAAPSRCSRSTMIWTMCPGPQ